MCGINTQKLSETNILVNKSLRRVGFGVLMLGMIPLINTAVKRMLPTKKKYADYLGQMSKADANQDSHSRHTGAYDGCLEAIDDKWHAVFSSHKSSTMTVSQLTYILLTVTGSRRIIRPGHLFKPNGKLRTNANEIAHALESAPSITAKLLDTAHQISRKYGLTKKTRHSSRFTRALTHKNTKKKETPQKKQRRGR
jgi:hypothetical protein